MSGDAHSVQKALDHVSASCCSTTGRRATSRPGVQRCAVPRQDFGTTISPGCDPRSARPFAVRFAPPAGDPQPCPTCSTKPTRARRLVDRVEMYLRTPGAMHQCAFARQLQHSYGTPAQLIAHSRRLQPDSRATCWLGNPSPGGAGLAGSASSSPGRQAPPSCGRRSSHVHRGRRRGDRAPPVRARRHATIGSGEAAGKVWRPGEKNEEKNGVCPFFLGALACALLLGFGYYLQYARGLEPCPLCWCSAIFLRRWVVS